MSPTSKRSNLRQVCGKSKVFVPVLATVVGCSATEIGSRKVVMQTSVDTIDGRLPEPTARGLSGSSAVSSESPPVGLVGSWCAVGMGASLHLRVVIDVDELEEFLGRIVAA